MAAAPRSPKSHIALGAYDVKGCLELLRKNADPSYKDEWKDERDSFTQTILDEGNIYEADVVAPALLAAIPSHLVIDTTVKMGAKKMASVLATARTKTLVAFTGTRDAESKTLREDLTHALLTEPGTVRVLWNPRLRTWKKVGTTVVWDNRVSEPDMLCRQGARATATPKWNAVDVKSHDTFDAVSTERAWKVSTLAAPYAYKTVTVARCGVPKKADALQLAHYQRSLEFHGLAGQSVGGVLGKPLDGALVVVWLDLTDRLFQNRSKSALDLYDIAFDAAFAVAEREMERRSDPTLDALTGPEWKGDCSTCVWKTQCHDELSDADHITLLPGITPARAKVHYAAGVTEVSQLARRDTKTATAVDAGATGLAERIVEAATLPKTQKVETMFSGRGAATQVAALKAAGIKTTGDLAGLDVATAAYSGTTGLTSAIDQARVTDFARVRRQTHVFRARGVKTLEVPTAKVEIHVDMENDEHVYLWGVRIVRHTAKGPVAEHVPFVTFEATDEAEAVVTAEFWKFLMDAIKDADKQYGKGNVLVFHYTAAEDRCLRHLIEKHAGTKGIPSSATLEKFLASDVWVDLYPILANQLVWPTENMTLKSLAKYVRFFWRDTDPSGANSVVWYKRAIDPSDPEAKDFQDRIVDYNADDCEATAVLLAWLQQFGKVRNLAKKLASVEDLEERYRRPAVRRIRSVA